MSRLFNIVEGFVKKVDFDQRDMRHYVVAGYSYRTLDFLSGAISSFRHKQYTSLPVLARAALESNVFLANIITHDVYDKLVYLHTYKEKMRIANNAERIESLAEVTAGEDFIGWKTWLQENIDALGQYSRDYNRLCGHVGKRFEALEMGDIYLSLYSQLCGEAHSDTLALESGNLLGDYDAWSFHRCKAPTRSTCLYVHTVLDLLVAIPRRLNEFLGLDRTAEVQGILEMSEEVKSLWELPDNEAVNFGQAYL